MNNRLAKLRKEIEASGIDAALITDEINKIYLTCFEFSGYLLVFPTQAYIITDPRYSEAARDAVSGEFTVVVPDGGRALLMQQLLSEQSAKNLGYEDNALTCAAYNDLSRSLPDTEFAPLGNMLHRLREIKDEVEIASIAKAQKIADAAFQHILKIITPNITEVELAIEIEYYMLKNGAGDKSFDTICVSGTASSLPHGKPRARQLEFGFLTMDFGAKVNGYCSDMTRTVVIGRADSEMKRIYDTVLAAQRAALDSIMAGAVCRDVDAAARNIIYDAGYGGCFGHGTGHGVGMQVHEAPRLSPLAGEAALLPGHVITVEPGIYIEGKYGCRIEDMAVITQSGSLNFTKSPKELIELF